MLGGAALYDTETSSSVWQLVTGIGLQLNPNFRTASTTSTTSDDVTGENGDRERGVGDDGAVGGVPRGEGGGD